MSEYWSGFLAGAVLSTIALSIVYSLNSIIKGYIRSIQAADNPQTVTHKTEKTPNQVVDAASQAKLKLWLVLGIVYILFVALLEYVRPGTVQDILGLFGF